MNDPLLREMLVLWPAWQAIVAHVTRSDARTAEPQSVFGAACGIDRDRLAALLYSQHLGDSLEESARLVDEVLRDARDGSRPRFGREMGFTPEMFGLDEEQAA